MNTGYLITIAVTAIVPVAAGAQPPATDPANPAAAASAPRYESAFRDYRQWREPQQSPAKTWRAVNDEVARAAEGMPAMNADMPMSDGGMLHRHDGHEGK